MRLGSVAPLVLVVVCASCKLGQDGEQSDRPLPPPEPASTNPPSRPVSGDDSPRTREPPRAPPKSAPAPEQAEPRPAAPSAAAPPSGAPSAAPAPTLALPAVDGGLSVPSAACLQQCQAGLSGCISKPVATDGGVPTLEAMAECKTAFESCRSACGL